MGEIFHVFTLSVHKHMVICQEEKKVFILFILFENFLDEMLPILGADLTLTLHVQCTFIFYFFKFLYSR